MTAPVRLKSLADERLVAVAEFPVQDPDDPETFPVIFAVIVPAEKFPLESLATTLLAVFAWVASTAQVVAEDPSKLSPVKYAPRDSAEFVLEAVAAFPDRVAVIVPAEKFPLPIKDCSLKKF